MSRKFTFMFWAKILSPIIITLCLTLLLYESLSNLLAHSRNVKNTFLNRNLTSKDKFGLSWGDFQYLADLTHSNTKRDGSFMYPPQSSDAWYGNGALLQYFFYPTKLYEENIDLVEQKKIDAIFINSKWPNFFAPIYKGYFGSIRSYAGIEFLSVSEESQNVNDNLILETSPELNLVSETNDIHINSHTINTSPENFYELIDFSVSQTGESIWLKQIDKTVDSKTKLFARVKAGKSNVVSLIGRVTYSNGEQALFSSNTTPDVNKWNELAIEDIYSRAVFLARQSNWPIEFRLTGIGVDIGISPNGPYPREGIGLIQNNQPQNDRQKVLTSESQYLEGLENFRLENYEEARINLEKAVSLNTSNTEAKYLLAKVMLKSNEESTASRILEENVRTDNDLWSGIELLKLIDKDNYEGNKNNINNLLLKYPSNIYLNYYLAKAYERLGLDILAYKHLMLATKDYPYSAISVKAGRSIDNKKKASFENTEYDKAKKAFLDGQFNESSKLMANLYNKFPKNEIYKRSLEEGYIITSYDFENGSIVNMDETISGISGRGVSIQNTDKSSRDVISLKPLVFPSFDRGLESGTLEFFWQAEDTDLYFDRTKRYFLLDQIGSLSNVKPSIGMFVKGQRLHVQLTDLSSLYPQRKILQSPPLDLEEGRWYQISLTWGDGKIALYLDKELIDKSAFNGDIGVDPNLNIGLAPDKADGSIYNPNDYTSHGVVDRIVVYSYPKTYEKRVQVWN